EEIVRKNTLYQQKYGKVVRRIVAPVVDVSSSQVRLAVANGQPIDNLVPPAVADYIKSKNLYREGGDHT
ncbi:MAG: hypothetical protein ACI4WV_06070, partial [Eubacteriales bacterium]